MEITQQPREDELICSCCKKPVKKTKFTKRKDRMNLYYQPCNRCKWQQKKKAAEEEKQAAKLSNFFDFSLYEDITDHYNR